MKYSIKYEYKKSKSNLAINFEGIYYVALGDDDLHVFNKPTKEKHFILILNNDSLFIVRGTVCEKISCDKPYEFDGVTLFFSIQSSLLNKINDKIDRIVKRYNFSPRVMILGSAVIVLLVVIIFQLVGKSGVSRDEMIDMEKRASVDEQGKMKELVEMRLKLIEKALETQKFQKAIDIIDKVLKIDPSNKVVLELKTEAKKRLEESKEQSKGSLVQDLWMQDTIREAGELMANGDFLSAKFKVQQIILKDPSNAQAVEMVKKINEEMESMEKEKIVGEEKMSAELAEAEEKFKAGLELRAAQKYVEAYKQLKSAVKTVEKFNAHPVFEVDLKDAYVQTKTIVEKEAQGLFAKAKEYHQKGKILKKPEDCSIFEKRALEEILKVKAMYDEIETDWLKTEIVENLNEVLKPLYVEAMTLQELEGCCFAKVKLQHIKNMAYSEEVKYYKMAEEAINKCVCNQ